MWPTQRKIKAWKIVSPEVPRDGRELHHIRTEKKEQAGYTQTFEVYGRSDCSGCGHKEKCFYKYDDEKNAVEGFLCPKIHTEKKKQEIPIEDQI